MMTEVDKYDEAAETSDEGDPVTQMIGRLESFEMTNSVIYMECSATTEDGRIWVEYSNGTASRIATQCPHCSKYVSLERKDLQGWQDAGNEIDARDWAQFICPECGNAWTEEQRAEANRTAKLVHKGQTIHADGTIEGHLPRTLTAGFRWNAANNLFKPAADTGWKEWKAQRSPDIDNSEKVICQHTWAIPFNEEMTDGIELDKATVASRLSKLPQFVLPDDVETLVVHIDLHKRWHNWTVVATSGHGAARYHTIVDYGATSTGWVEGTDNHVAAMRHGLKIVKETLEEKQYVTEGGVEWGIDLHLVDAGYEQDMGLQFVQSVGGPWMLVKGFNPVEANKYKPPQDRTDDVVPGYHFHFSKQLAIPRRWWLIIADTGYWMRRVHAGFAATAFLDGARRPGSIALYGDDASLHQRPAILGKSRTSFAEQILGWKWISAFDPRKGNMQGWTIGDCDDHWFDNLYNALMGDCVVRQLHKRFQQAAPAPVKSRQPIKTPDGRPFVATQRALFP